MPITAVIIAFNEARHIVACVEAARQVADEVLVIDSGSGDGTQALAEKAGARVVQQAWLGYGPQKNFGHSLATHPYILSLDADERPDAQLIQAIKAAKEAGLTGAYQVMRLNWFYDRFVRQGLEYPDPKIRLFAKEAMWGLEGVHETLALPEGTVITALAGHLEHYSYATVAEHLERTHHYARLAAAHMHRAGQKATLSKLVFSPFFTFIKSFVLKGGYKGGMHGFILASVSAWSKLSKYAMLYGMRNTPPGG